MSINVFMSRTDTVRAYAPGKLILSGEHSVVYGGPALAAALTRYAEVWFKPVRVLEGLRTAFEGLSQGEVYPLKLLSQFKRGLDQRFDQFSRGELPVHKILTRPDDLAVYTLAMLLQEAPVKGIGAVGHLPHPGQLGSVSDLPIGAGLGSSAATIAATTILFEHLLNRPKTPMARIDRVRFCERLQHGRAGAIDASTVVHGGCVLVQDETATPVSHSGFGAGWFCVLDGVPASSTGECVSAVAASHGHDRLLWDAFAACTLSLYHTLSGDPDDAIRENHALLQRIGVVPEATADLITSVEELGGAAKICGAGSVRGDNGGAVLVHCRDTAAFENLMAKRPERDWFALEISQAGAGFGPAPVRPSGQGR